MGHRLLLLHLNPLLPRGEQPPGTLGGTPGPTLLALEARSPSPSCPIVASLSLTERSWVPTWAGPGRSWGQKAWSRLPGLGGCVSLHRGRPVPWRAQVLAAECRQGAVPAVFASVHLGWHGGWGAQSPWTHCLCCSGSDGYFWVSPAPLGPQSPHLQPVTCSTLPRGSQDLYMQALATLLLQVRKRGLGQRGSLTLLAGREGLSGCLGAASIPHRAQHPE